MAQEIAAQLLAGALQVLSTMVLSAGALYTGVSVLDRLTAGIDEWKEIKKGNLAVGLFFATVMFAVTVLMGPRIHDFSLLLQPQPVIPLMGFAFVNYLIGLALSITVIYLAIHIIDNLTRDLDEMAELKKGNTSVALILSMVLFAVSTTSAVAMDTIFTIIKAWELSLLLP